MAKQPTPDKIAHYLRIAFEEAEKGVVSGDGGPFGAVVVKNDEIVVRAHNEVLKINDPTLHAEVNAIRKAAEKLQTLDLSGCILYSSCEPCPMCFGASLWAHLDKVYYGCTDKDADAFGFNDKRYYQVLFDEKQRREFCVQFPMKESTDAMKVWENKADKRTY